jgi:hypothetical protein
MSSETLTADGGRLRPRMSWLLGLAALMAALATGRILSRTDAQTDTAHQQRGLDYEDHVLAPNQLPFDIRQAGGQLIAHPPIYVPRIEIPALYYAAPGGHDGPLIPHEPRRKPRPWRTVHTAGAARIPDAIATHADGTQTLFELKCPSPWLTFATGTPWATKMQTAFASQAAAFLTWASLAPGRKVRYGFCGWIPPWATAILNDLSAHLDQPVITHPTFFAEGFQPAQSLMGRAARDLLATQLEELAPEDLAGAGFDMLKD